jgi:hypothetical protein
MSKSYNDTHFQPLQLIKKIEEKYSVEDIEVNGLKIWPHLRIYIGSITSINTKKEAPLFFIKLFFSSFFYGFTNLFKSYDYIFYSNTIERRKINGIYVDKSFDYLMSILPKSLDIEIPLPKHFKRKEIPTKNIVSKLFFYGLETFYAKVFLHSLKIKNEQILIDLLTEFKIDINYKHYIKRFIAQYFSTIILAKIYKPKAVFVECYYTNIGRIYAYNKLNISTIEIQHGVINNSHLAYNIYKKFDHKFFPNYLFSFGNNEKKIAKNENFYIKNENVYPIGSFYIDHINSANIVYNNLKKYRISYKFIVCVTGQNHYSEPILINFLNKVGDLNNDILFVFVPRDASFQKKDYHLNTNIMVIPELNCYETISISDFHSTVYSTCALESASLGIPNILININGLSKINYAEILNNPLTCRIVDSPEEFIEVITTFKKIEKPKIKELNSNIIIPNYKNNIFKIINEISIN